MARPNAPQQVVARGKTILSDHAASQGSERSAGTTPTHGMGKASAGSGAGKLNRFDIILLKAYNITQQ